MNDSILNFLNNEIDKHTVFLNDLRKDYYYKKNKSKTANKIIGYAFLYLANEVKEEMDQVKDTLKILRKKRRNRKYYLNNILNKNQVNYNSKTIG
jgi:hypothetical protein